MAGDLIYWLGWIAVLLLYAAMVYLAWRALFHDRPHGRRRCPRCWYDVSYSPGMTCAECGFTAVDERQFARTRRRYGRAAVAILVCVVVAGVVHERVSRAGWTSTLPGAVLITLLPLSGNDNGGLFMELYRRLTSGDLSDAQVARLMRRAAAGDWWARPADDRWIKRYGNLVHRSRRGISPEPTPLPSGGFAWPAYADAERPLLDIPPRFDLSIRATWPEGTTAYVRLNLREWWPRGCEARIHITPRTKDAATVIVRRSNLAPTRSALAIPVGAIEPGVTSVTVDVLVEHRRPGAEDAWRQVAVQELTIPVSVGGAIDELIAPVEDEALTSLLQQTFAGEVSRWSEGPSAARFRYIPAHTLHREFDDVAVGLAVELWRGERLARRLDIWWLGGEAAPGEDEALRALGWEVVYEDEALLAARSDDDADDAAAEEESPWHFVVRGEPEIALRAGDVASYWSGSFTVPARFFEMHGPAPPPEWRHERARPLRPRDAR